jgi:uncharacterized protein HemY
MRKGFELTTSVLAIIIFLIIVVLVIFMFYRSFAAEAGSPTSEFFFKLFDFITGWVS